MQKPHNTELIFFWILFAVVGVLSYFIFAPYLTIIFLSVVLAIVLHKPYQWFLNKFKGRENLAASVMIVIAIFAILIPAFILGSLLTGQVVDVYNMLTQNGGPQLSQMTESLNNTIHRSFPASTIQINITSLIESFLQYLSSNLNKLFLSVASIFFDAMLLVIALFFFIRDGEMLRDFALKWSPLPKGYSVSILNKLGHAISSVVKGTVVVAGAQGVATGIGLAIFGVPGSLLLAFVATFTALIPVVGTGLVTFPAIIYLIFKGSYLAAVALTLWSIVLVGNVDTLLRPLLMKKDLNLHPFLIILSVIGGMSFFGPIGFIAGPIVVALLFVLLDIYPAIVSGKKISDTGEEI